MKTSLEQQVKTYADTFERWVEAHDRVRPRSTASGVKDLADSVAVEAESLEAKVRQFLDNVQAA